jgi:glycosyltransferase involved in cell wall biosynthesis
VNIIVIAYNFPPCGGGGVQRATKLVKYLSRFGHSVTVVAASPGDYKLMDESLAAEIPSTVRVLRFADRAPLKRFFSGIPVIPKREPQRFFVRAFNKLTRIAAAWTIVPDLQRAWASDVERALVPLFDGESFDAIISTSFPYSDHLLGLALSRRLGLALVADFRDPWVRNHFAPPPWPVLRRNLILESSVVAAASKVVVVSEPMIEIMEKDHPVACAGKMHCITNGYDEEDFSGYLALPSKGFEILFAGSIYGPITLDYLVEGMVRASRELGLAAGAMTLRVIGMKKSLVDTSLKAANDLGITCLTAPYLPHSEIIGHYSRASVLALVLPKIAMEAIVYSGKLFEYLRAGKPILGLVGEGVAANLIRRSRSGIVVDPEDRDGIRKSVVQLYTDWSSGKVFTSDLELIARYGRESQARDFERLLVEAVNEKKRAS